MTENRYDATVVGARCAGSQTPMLLARVGYRVLVVDQATFPSDTIATHLVHQPGVAALRRWRLLDRLMATGCAPIDTCVFDFGPFTISGSPGTDDIPVAYGPRQTVLDKLLVDAASEVRDGFTVSDLVFEDERVTGSPSASNRSVNNSLPPAPRSPSLSPARYLSVSPAPYPSTPRCRDGRRRGHAVRCITGVSVWILRGVVQVALHRQPAASRRGEGLTCG